MKRIADVTLERLRELLDYDPSTGVFTWKVRRQKIHVGQVAGAPNSRGYLVIGVENRVYAAHRLAWLHFYGVWPTDDIDHINRVKHDNRIVNLRAATHAQNLQNTPIRRTNTSGYRGVSWNKRLKKWTAQIATKGVQTHLGCFNSAEAAYEAYVAAANRFHSHSPILSGHGATT